MILYSKDFETHIQILKEVFSNTKSRLKYLGDLVIQAGVHLDPDKRKATVELPTPKSVKEFIPIFF